MEVGHGDGEGSASSGPTRRRGCGPTGGRGGRRLLEGVGLVPLLEGWWCGGPVRSFSLFAATLSMINPIVWRRAARGGPRATNVIRVGKHQHKYEADQ